MRQIFIFTAGDKKARVHLDDSILKPVSFEWMQEALGQEQTQYYQSLIPDQQGFHAWGAVPGPVNQRTWTAMQVGDLVLTVYANQYHFLSTVIGKLHNQALASRIWGKDEEGNTWEYMYLLSEPQNIATDVLSPPAVDYLNKGYRGFTRISDDKVQTIVKDFGSLDSFVEQVFQAHIPEGHIEREIEQAEKDAEASVAFAPKDMVDGRKKVLQEVVRRQGQPKFRKALLAAYGKKCAVTGCDVESVLEAAHIAPYLGKESNAVQNGLLLRADIHTLFDLGELKITEQGQVQLHETLFGTVYEQYQGQQITFPANQAFAPSVEALALKFERVL